MSEKYGITDAHYLCDSAIFNTETDEILRLYQICDLLNQQDQRIAELEEQLKNAIVPKFKSEDVAFRVNIFTKDIERVVIVSTKIEIICGINISYTIACLGENQTLANIDIRNIIEDFGTYISQEREEELFSTKEEALKKLEELQGENNG